MTEVRQCVQPGRRPAGYHHLRGRRRQRLERRSGRRREPRGLPGLQPARAGLRRDALECANGRSSRETVWNDGAEGGATGGGFSVICAAARGRRERRDRLPRTTAACPMWPAMPIPNRLRGAGGWSRHGDRRNQRGGAALGGLIALLNEELGQTRGLPPAGPLQLGASTEAFHDITQGINGSFSAAPAVGCLHRAGIAIGRDSPCGARF